MFNQPGPDRLTDVARFHAQEFQRTLQHDERAQAKLLTRIRLIVRRVLRRQAPPASP